ncbi:MAG: diguanylate cyclase [Candidatus Tectomicrobia bacterium]|uniref:diguanylate cyclase n=1 Tax=Tectimicrobiota bacterium TaxID=2528274 RepID=A0A932CQ50_UNCTE|nr:diguanylate cyclase [Candidatus Tectomicrobia bacterium]
MTRKTKTERSSGYTILLVDDNQEYLEVTQRLLEREGHRVLGVTNGPEALALLRGQPVDLLLLDYYMPGMTGEEVVVQLRQFNPYVQVILQTGYASEQPPREMLRRLDIQGYYDKSEGPEKLLLWADVGLKAAYTVQLLRKSQRGLRYILDVTPELHKIQPLEDLLQGILWQVTGLLGIVNAFLAVIPEGQLLQQELSPPNSFLAVLEEDTDLIIRACTGRFVVHSRVADCLEPRKFVMVRNALQLSEIQAFETATIVPLRVGELILGVIYLDRSIELKQDIELLSVFANQAAVAIQNAQLYEMATVDPLTRIYVRRFFEYLMLRELQTAFRSQQPLALLMIDFDGMKVINDTAGHLVGDEALVKLGRVLRQVTRSSDIVGRYGGDEFAIILPRTDTEGAERVGERVLDLLQSHSVSGPDGAIPLRSSVGLSILAPHTLSPEEIPRPVPYAFFQKASKILMQQADEALYRAKSQGGGQVCTGAMTHWPAMSGIETGPGQADES